MKMLLQQGVFAAAAPTEPGPETHVRGPVKLVIFGLTVSSSWGNGHATLWRGLIRALSRRGHRVVFFEKDVPYYAKHRDLAEMPDAELVLYQSWDAIVPKAQAQVSDADVAMVTSY